MIPIYENGALALEEILRRRGEEGEDAAEVALEIVREVRAGGDEALLNYTEQFDGVRLPQLAVSKEEIEQAAAKVDPAFLETLRLAAENIRAFHQKQQQQGFVLAETPGVMLGQKVTPLEKVGVYVPGGTAAYPSTVLMNVIPAKIAGVEQIIMVSPPGRDGKLNQNVLAAAHVAGVSKVFCVGGAQAVAALAYGTQSIPRVDKIVGPGNRYVAAAKKMVYGQVAIDMIAGPSEILIVADDTATPALVAADLLSQAEHDPLAASVLVTTSKTLAQKVQQELQKQLAALPRKKIAQSSLEANGKILLADTVSEAIQLSNQLAPEHLELCVDDPFAYLPQVKHAGSIFLGHHSPEPLGDYFAGPNHTLPTSGTARFSSPLSVDDFIKRSSFLYYSKEALAKVGGRVAEFARREGLEAHANSILLRLDEKSDSRCE